MTRGMSNGDPGSQLHIWIFSILDLGFRIQGSKKHQIPDPDQQHWPTGVKTRDMNASVSRIEVRVLSATRSCCLSTVLSCQWRSKSMFFLPEAIKVNIQSISGSQSPCSTCKLQPKPILFLQVTVKVSSNQNHCSPCQWQSEYMFFLAVTAQSTNSGTDQHPVCVIVQLVKASMHCTENSKQIFAEMKLCVLVPCFCW
jgi:hypothetical protein